MVFLWLVFSPSLGLGTKFVNVQSLCFNRVFSSFNTPRHICKCHKVVVLLQSLNLNIHVEVRADSLKY